MSEDARLDLINLTAEITANYVQNNRLSTAEIGGLIKSVHDALSELHSPAPSSPVAPEHVPAVSARKSLADPNHIVSMIDGKSYKSLTRHLGSNGLTPAEYRERYGLKADYPMTAPAYSEHRRALAKAIGLGRKPGSKVTPKAETAEPQKRGRKPRAVASAPEPAA